MNRPSFGLCRGDDTRAARLRRRSPASRPHRLWMWAALAAGCADRPPVAPPELGVAWAELAPGLETAELTRGQSRIRALRFDQGRHQLRLLAPAGGVQVPTSAPAEAEAIWNGGYFEPDLRPSGLLIDQGREVAPPSAGSAMLLLGERATLVRFQRAVAPGLRESALQLWPFLIEPGGADGIRRDDGRRARRSAIGLDDAGRGVLLAVTGEGVSLFALMAVCRQLGLVVAVNLDGGPSTGFAVLRPTAVWSEPSQSPVANALVLLARAGR